MLNILKRLLNWRVLIVATVLILTMLGLLAAWDYSSGKYMLAGEINNLIRVQWYGESVLMGIGFLVIGYFTRGVRNTAWAGPLFSLGIVLLGLAACISPGHKPITQYVYLGFPLLSFNVLQVATALSLPLLLLHLTGIEERRRNLADYIIPCLVCFSMLLFCWAVRAFPVVAILSVIYLAMLLKALITRQNWRVRPYANAALLLPLLAVAAMFVANYDRFAARYAAFAFRNDPWGAGYETMLGLRYIHSGHIVGMGFGSFSQGTHFFHPFMLHQSILAIIGREFGLLGILAVVALLALLGYASVRYTYAVNETLFARNMRLTMLLLLLIPAIIGVLRVLNLSPFLPYCSIPFIGYNHTALLLHYFAVGIIIGPAVKITSKNSVPVNYIPPPHG